MNNYSDFNIIIDNNSYNIEDWSFTLIQQCEFLNITIPRFCYHDRLSIAGNCRMCLVEVSSSIKPVIACGTSIINGMVIKTNTRLVRSIRESILEFLLINHPLDCPICDQGGECDLQDQVHFFGSEKSRFSEIKRSSNDKFFSPVIKTIMTRCIHCTRCIRFTDEYLGNFSIGSMGRGKLTEISNYDSSYISHEMSGNLIDLCPVGALTAKSHSFSSRPWEFTSIETIDVLDGLCSNIRVDIIGSNIIRILPRLNEELNEEWISNKIRFCYDSIYINRCIQPYISSIFFSSSWKFALNYFLLFFLKYRDSSFYNKKSFHIGNQVDLDSSFLLKKFFFFSDSNSLGFFPSDFRTFYLLKYSLRNFLKFYSFLIFNINISIESSYLNLKFQYKKSFFGKGSTLSYIGSNIKLNYEFLHLGNSLNTFVKILEGRHFYCNNIFDYNTHFLFGESIHKLNTKILTSNFPHRNISLNYLTSFSERSGISELGNIGSYLNNTRFLKKNYSFYYFINYNALNYYQNYYDYDKIYSSFIVFQGSHISNNIPYVTHRNSSSSISILLPSACFLEYSGLFINCEGKLQYTNQVLTLTEMIKSNKDIILSILMLYRKNIADSFKNSRSIFLKKSFFSYGYIFSHSLFRLHIFNFFKFSCANLISFSLLGKSFSIQLSKTFINYNTFYTSIFLSPRFSNYYTTDNLSLFSHNIRISSDYSISNFNFNLVTYNHIL